MNHVANAFEAVLPFLFNSETEMNASIDLGIHDLETFRADVGSSRVVARHSTPIQREPKGNLRTRVYSLADDTALYDSQMTYREAIVNHPAYQLVLDELRSREHLGMLWEAMDLLEEMGVVVTYDKSCKLLTLGFCLSKMRQGFQEVIPLRDFNNARVIAWVNKLPEVSLTGYHSQALRKPAKADYDEDDDLTIFPVAPVYYITLDLT